jgi:two-component system response regulator NreC
MIVEPQTLFRQGLRALFSAEPDFVIVAECADARSAYAAADEHRPNVVLIAIELEGVDGIAATRELLRRRPEARVVVLTMHADPTYRRLARAAGARGYVLKTQDVGSLTAAIHAAHGDGEYVAPQLERVESGVHERTPLALLSQREREVFSLIVRGHSNASIARELSISVKTVETHRTRINRKFDVHSSADLLRFAMRHRISG